MIIKTEIIYKSHYKYYAEWPGWKDPVIYLKEGRSACTLSGDSRVVLAKVESVSWECISVINLKLLGGYLNSGTNLLKFFTRRHDRMWSKYLAVKTKIQQVNLSSHVYSFVHENSYRIGSCGLYYKPMKIVTDDARVVNKLEASLTDNARVVNYDRHMFIVQASDFITSL